jgi:hypothetical protein
MTAFYIVLKVGALLAVILIPLIGPKQKNTNSLTATGKLAVNENGLSYINDAPVNHLVG